MPVCKAEAHRALELLEDYYRFVLIFTSIVILCLCVFLGISCPMSVCLLSVCLYPIYVSVVASLCLSLSLYLFGHMGVFFVYTYTLGRLSKTT